ncbi:GreA/GreB family elongation factor [Paraburkholderia phenoliruptrix]|uniref:GreA/GreB family elongation factor n=1 Tax=Paraburkholderia phenoliruptrix TaxID=252970 RepID=UPI0034CE9F54
MVYPDRADYLMGCLSVLSPAGISLLGARCGQIAVCRPPSGVQIRYVIKAILLQPESLHLAQWRPGYYPTRKVVARQLQPSRS